MGLFKTCPEQLKFSAILYDLHLISVAFTYHQTQEMKPHSKFSAMGLNCVTMEKNHVVVQSIHHLHLVTVSGSVTCKRKSRNTGINNC